LDVPFRRDVLKKALDIEAERIQKAGITTQFDTKEIRVMDDGSVQYSGVLKSSTTNGAIITPLKDQEKTYRLKLSYDNGVINLHSFEELSRYPPLTDRTAHEISHFTGSCCCVSGSGIIYQRPPGRFRTRSHSV
jgi:conjugal transfer pilus assembly protein TraE